MRYVINDDDLENWYAILFKLNEQIHSDDLSYVLIEIEKEFSTQVVEENLSKFLSILRGEK